MNPLTLEWVELADADYVTARREFRARKLPNYGAACFHAQQCAAKYLKALLQEHDIPFGRTHDLVELLDKVVPLSAEWELLRPELRDLTGFAVQARYPGVKADKQSARLALASCRVVRAKARASLGLQP